MLAQIEQGIKDTLHAYNQKHGGGHVRAIKSYNDDFNAQSASEFAQVVASFPAIWVTFKSSGKPERIGAKKRVRPYVFTVLVAAVSARNEEASRQGAFKSNGEMLSIGSYQLIEMVENALLANKLGLDIAPLEAGEITMLSNSKTSDEVASVMAYDFYTTATVYDPDREVDTPWLETVNVDYVYFDHADTDSVQQLATDQINLNPLNE